MHARLRVRRWSAIKANILQGGWYPAVPDPERPFRVRVDVDGEPVVLSTTILSITESPRTTAVWGTGASDGCAVVVCPEGHHIRDGVAPAKPFAWCTRCKLEYEIET